MLFKFIRKLLAGMLILALCLGLASCSNKKVDDTTMVDEETYLEVEQLQNDILLLDSGRLDIISQSDSTKNTEIVKADFVFDVSDDGKLSYIQYQYDKKGKIIACEYSDGIVIEQWLIGNGWCTMSTNPYTIEKPHRYLQLISTTPTINSIEDITSQEKNKDNLFTLTLNAEELNNTTYKDSASKVQNELIELNTNQEGELTKYLNTAKLTNTDTDKESIYTLEISVSDYDEEIVKPELKEYKKDDSHNHSHEE